MSKHTQTKRTSHLVGATSRDENCMATILPDHVGVDGVLLAKFTEHAGSQISVLVMNGVTHATGSCQSLLLEIVANTISIFWSKNVPQRVAGRPRSMYQYIHRVRCIEMESRRPRMLVVEDRRQSIVHLWTWHNMWVISCHGSKAIQESTHRGRAPYSSTGSEQQDCSLWWMW